MDEKECVRDGGRAPEREGREEGRKEGKADVDVY